MLKNVLNVAAKKVSMSNGFDEGFLMFLPPFLEIEHKRGEFK